MTSILNVINTIKFGVYDVDIRSHKHHQVWCLWRRYSTLSTPSSLVFMASIFNVKNTIKFGVYDVDIRLHNQHQ
ncbi:Hypothetical predicted protein, partial [Paramuricea clavata]